MHSRRGRNARHTWEWLADAGGSFPRTLSKIFPITRGNPRIPRALLGDIGMGLLDSVLGCDKVRCAFAYLFEAEKVVATGRPQYLPVAPGLRAAPLAVVLPALTCERIDAGVVRAPRD